MSDYQPTRIAATAPGSRLGALKDFPDGACRELAIGDGETALRVFVFRRDRDVKAFINLCPHFQLRLNNGPEFLMWDDESIMCTHHTAIFRLSDGYCTGGPCLGMRLERFAVSVIDGHVVIGERNAP